MKWIIWSAFAAIRASDAPHWAYCLGLSGSDGGASPWHAVQSSQVLTCQIFSIQKMAGCSYTNRFSTLYLHMFCTFLTRVCELHCEKLSSVGVAAEQLVTTKPRVTHLPIPIRSAGCLDSWLRSGWRRGWRGWYTDLMGSRPPYHSRQCLSHCAGTRMECTCFWLPKLLFATLKSVREHKIGSI